MVLLALLLAAALTWMALTEANLVVRATGRVRPVSNHEDSSDDFSEEISCEIGGRVVAVRVDEGDRVREGDVLLQLDTTRIENRIATVKQTIQTGEEELEKLRLLEQLLVRHFDSAKRKAEAELAEVEEELASAGQRQAAGIRLAKLKLAETEDKERRTRKLAANGAVTQEQLVEAVTRAAEARERLREAELPVDQGKLDVLRRAIEVVHREHEVKRGELEIKRRAKLGEIETARLQLANLELDRRQAVVCASTDGVVTMVATKIGDIIEPGKLGITMARQKGFQFEVTVSNADVAHLRTGLPARIKLDAYDYQKYGTLAGTLKTLAPDSEVMEGPEGTQVAVYKVEITLSQDEVGRDEHHGPVRLGMTGQAEIVTDRESILTLLLRRIRQSISLG
ncbi:MAG: HlyD family efflux transporter periplasmic adaptor subunit [Thermoguttaceae bacterium]